MANEKIPNAAFFVKLAVVSVFFLVAFLPIYSNLLDRFTGRDSYYSHGFLIPLIVIFLIWRKKEKLSTLKAHPSFAGFLVLVFGIVIYLVGGVVLTINFASYIAFPIVIFGIIYYLGGKEFARELLFPVGFLIFMVPLPTVVIIAISFKMKMFATSLATAMINTLGIAATQAGSTIYFPGGKLLVGDPCSGLRSLISFLALGALFFYLAKAAPWRRNTLLLSTIPIALGANLIRILLIFFVMYVYGEDVALGFFHDFSGFMVFVLGLLGFMGLSKILKCQIAL